VSKTKGGGRQVKTEVAAAEKNDDDDDDDDGKWRCAKIHAYYRDSSALRTD